MCEWADGKLRDKPEQVGRQALVQSARSDCLLVASEGGGQQRTDVHARLIEMGADVLGRVSRPALGEGVT